MNKVGLLFPGQGSQYIGMGKVLYDTIRSARKLMNDADQILGYSIRDLIFDGTETDLCNTKTTQPAIFIVSMMYFEKWKQQNLEFSFVAGHSLGEYSALCAAGVMDFESTLQLVQKRGKFMAECCSADQGMMAVIGIPIEELIKITKAHSLNCTIANINSKTQTVVSGVRSELTKLENIILEDGKAQCKWLNVSGAFHSSLMKTANDALATEIQKVAFRNPVCGVLPNLTGIETNDPSIVRDALLNQMVSPVNWFATILRLKELGADVLYEVGPGEILKKLNTTITFKPKCLSISMNGDGDAKIIDK